VPVLKAYLIAQFPIHRDKGCKGIDMKVRSLHSRQFVLGPKPALPDARFTSDEVWSGCFLSNDPSLPVMKLVDRSGQPWLLIGWAFQSALGLPPPHDQICSGHSAEVVAARVTWVGKWCLIGRDAGLYTDACAHLAVFYMPDRSSDNIWISSSPAILNDIDPATPEEIDPRMLEFCVGIYWYVPPRTRFARVRKLLPSQRISLNGRITGHGLFMPIETTSYDELVDELGEAITTSVSAMSGAFENVWIATSAGHDSRVVLAGALAAGVQAKAYTHEFDIMPEADKTYAPQIAAAAGYAHFWSRPKSIDANVLKLVDQHTAGHATSAIDRQFLACQQWDFGGENDVALRGGGFEVGRCYYHWIWPTDRSQMPDAETLVCNMRDKPSGSLRSAVHEWREWVAADKENRQFDWRDRVCMEQTYSGWFSYVELALSLAPLLSLNPVNCTRTYSLIMKVPQHLRSKTEHQKDVVRRLAPRLAEYPFLQSIVVPAD
jgi:hypothetical protein